MVFIFHGILDVRISKLLVLGQLPCKLTYVIGHNKNLYKYLLKKYKHTSKWKAKQSATFNPYPWTNRVKHILIVTLKVNICHLKQTRTKGGQRGQDAGSIERRIEKCQ